MSERDNYLIQAKLAQSAGRYNEMILKLKGVVKYSPDLTTEERNMVNVAYKGAIDSRRTSWLVVETVEHKSAESANDIEMDLIRDYKRKIEKELTVLCKEIVGMVDDCLLSNATSAEAVVSFYKIKADFCRYLTEFQTGDALAASTNSALEAYRDAYSHASLNLQSTNPTRLSVALNFSVFYHDIIQSTEKAYEIANESYNFARHDLNSLPDHAFTDATDIMQILKEDMMKWSKELSR